MSAGTSWRTASKTAKVQGKIPEEPATKEAHREAPFRADAMDMQCSMLHAVFACAEFAHALTWWGNPCEAGSHI